MLTQDTVVRIRALDARPHPVLSLYLGLRPEVGELRSVPARLKDLLAPVRHSLAGRSRAAAMSLRADIDAVLGSMDRLGADLGRGVAIFRSAGAGIDEYVSLPVPVRDRAVVDDAPYVRPLDAVLEHAATYAVIVMERRRATLYRATPGMFRPWEVLEEEEVRKANYGGFSGYDERRVRTRTSELAHRLYRDVANRLHELWKGPGFDYLVVGGSSEHVDGLIAELHPDLRATVAGRFSIDPHTATPALVSEHYEEVARDHHRRLELDLAHQVVETAAAGGAAYLGVDPVLTAVNQRAVDHLVVQGSRTLPGKRCSDCGWLTAGNGSLCPACGEGMKRVPDLLDAMAGAVRTSGGAVDHLLTDTPLSEHEVGALLRYRVAGI